MSVRTWSLAAALALAAAGSCVDATDVDLLEIPDTGVLGGQAFLDANGNGAIDTGDAALATVGVLLIVPGSGVTAKEATTDANGVFIMEDVPLGSYSLELAAAVLGDSLTTVGAPPTVNIEYGDTLVFTIGATYPTLTLAEIRAATPGRRVFTHGIALNSRQSNGDGVVHLQEGSTFVRATAVAPIGLLPGDSVRMLGRTATDIGQPTLDQVTTGILRAQAVFVTPQVVTVAAANTAGAGTLDAALVRVGPAEITDTATVGGHLQFWAYNGADSVQVLLRDYLVISPNPPIRPDTIVRVAQVTGLLRPYTDASGTRWRLLPRGGADVVTETKLADVGVGTSFDVASAAVGDTVEIRVTARNGGFGFVATHVATGVAVLDTVPAGLTYVSSTATRGSYDPATRLWTVGDLAPGAVADTLRIRAEVVGPGPVENRAYFQGLVLEVETNGANNAAATNPDLGVS